MPHTVHGNGSHKPKDVASINSASTDSTRKTTDTARPRATSLDYLLGPRKPESSFATADEEIDEHIKQKSLRIAELIALRDFDPSHWSDIYAEDYSGVVGTPEQQGIIEGCEAYVQYFKEYLQAHPSYRIHVVDTLVQVDTHEGTASAWVHMKVTGNPESVQRANITHLTLSREEDGEWRIIRQAGIRGLGGFDA